MIYQNFKRVITIGFGIIALALAIFIAARSLMPARAITSIVHADKWIHALAYCTLGIFTLPSLPRLKPFFTWLFLCGFGICIEIGQGSMSMGRSADPLDAVANSIGAFLAILVWLGLSFFWNRIFSEHLPLGESTSQDTTHNMKV